MDLSVWFSSSYVKWKPGKYLVLLGYSSNYQQGCCPLAHVDSTAGLFSGMRDRVCVFHFTYCSIRETKCAFNIYYPVYSWLWNLLSWRGAVKGEEKNRDDWHRLLRLPPREWDVSVPGEQQHLLHDGRQQQRLHRESALKFELLFSSFPFPELI